MPPKKKTKTGDGVPSLYERKELFDFIITLGTIARLYRVSGDTRRSESFEKVTTNLRIYRDVSETLKSSDDYKSVEGVGKSTLSLIDEFIETGTCARLNELVSVAQEHWKTSFNWQWEEDTHPDDMLLVLIDPDGDYVLDPVTDRLVSGLVIYNDDAWIFTLDKGDHIRWVTNPEDGLPKDQFPWFHENIGAFINEVKKATGSKRTLKKAKAAKVDVERKLFDFIITLETIARLYETDGDTRRAESFSTAAKNLRSERDLSETLKSSDDYKSVEGVGKSTLLLIEDFIETGTCSRLLPLIRVAQEHWKYGFFINHGNAKWMRSNDTDVLLDIRLPDYRKDYDRGGTVTGLVICEWHAWIFTMSKDSGEFEVKWHNSVELLKDKLHWFYTQLDSFTAKLKTMVEDKRTLKDFVLILGSIANKYETLGDVGRAKSFNTAAKKLSSFASLDNELTDSTEYENIKGVGKSTLELMDEFIKTGKCARLDELGEKDNQVPLIEDGPSEADLELGVFDYEDEEKGSALFLYDPVDKYPLYKDIEDTFSEQIHEEEGDLLDKAMSDGRYGFDENVTEEAFEYYAGYGYLSEEYRHWEKYFFVRKATAKDRKRKDWEGDADPNWQKPEKNGITREELKELVRDGFYEEKYKNAYDQLIKEEKAFLDKAKTDLREALEDFPYQEVAYDGGFDLLVDDTILDLDGYKLYCRKIEAPEQDHLGEYEQVNAEVYYELHLCGKSCYLALRRYGCHEHWTDGRAFYFTEFDTDEEFKWQQNFESDDDEYGEQSFCNQIAECSGVEELNSTELMYFIQELYDKHNLRGCEYD